MALEDIEQAIAGNEAREDKKDVADAEARAVKRRANRGALPPHLPRGDVTIEPEDTNCPCCRAPMQVIGEQTSQRLDVVPAQFRVIVTHLPRDNQGKARFSFLPRRLPLDFGDAKAAPGKGKSRGFKALRCCTSRRNSGCSTLVTSCALFMPSATHAQNCPAPLEGARRLLLVTFDSMISSAATLRLFERPHADGAWQLVHPPEPAVLGVNGAAWGPGFRQLAGPGDPVKTEGDKRTPAGIFALGQPFGFAPSPLARHLQLKPDTVCVDDPTSAAYNTITSRKNLGQKVTVEYMRKGALYRRGLVVIYPTNATTRAGSCIFIHVWRNPTSGTAGCIGLPEARVAALQEFVVQRTAVLAVLPDEALDRLANCLPPATGKPY